jgi:hypothetical protein
MINQVKKVFLAMLISVIALNASGTEDLKAYIQASVSEEQLEINKNIHDRLTEQDKVMLMRLMYREMKKRENASLEEKERLVKELTRISKIASKNILKNQSFVIDLPHFSYTENRSIKAITSSSLRLVSDRSYSINFDKKEIFESGSRMSYFKGMTKGHINENIIGLRLDSMRNMFIISKPIEGAHLMVAIDIDPIRISEEWLTDQVRQTIPNFNKGE